MKNIQCCTQLKRFCECDIQEISLLRKILWESTSVSSINRRWTQQSLYECTLYSKQQQIVAVCDYVLFIIGHTQSENIYYLYLHFMMQDNIADVNLFGILQFTFFRNWIITMKMKSTTIENIFLVILIRKHNN